MTTPGVPMSRIVAVIGSVLLLPGATVRAETTDYHALFEERCTACHGHAGDFSRDRLQVQNGEVTSRTGRDLEDFLTRHKGGLPADEIRGLLGMFLSQVGAGTFFKDTCMTCHDRAYDFARLFLIERDGVLWGRYSARPVAEFLPGHARMTQEQAARMTAALAAILAGGR